MIKSLEKEGYTITKLKKKEAPKPTKKQSKNKKEVLVEYEGEKNVPLQQIPKWKALQFYEKEYIKVYGKDDMYKKEKAKK